MIIDNVTVEKLLFHAAWRQGFTTQALANSTITLTIDSNHVQCFTGTAVGQIVQLPSATTLAGGQRYDFINLGTQSVSIKDGSGAVIFTVLSNASAQFLLVNASTTAGAWAVRSSILGTASGIINYKVTSSASFTPGTADVLITGMTQTPVAGTYAVWFSASVQIVTNNVSTNISIFNGASQITDSLRTVQNSVSTFNTIVSTQTTAQFNGTNVCEVHTSRSGGTMTMTGRSLILIRLGD
jgi:hypothetical protein